MNEQRASLFRGTNLLNGHGLRDAVEQRAACAVGACGKCEVAAAAGVRRNQKNDAFQGALVGVGRNCHRQRQEEQLRAVRSAGRAGLGERTGQGQFDNYLLRCGDTVGQHRRRRIEGNSLRQRCRVERNRGEVAGHAVVHAKTRRDVSNFIDAAGNDKRSLRWCPLHWAWCSEGQSR